MQLTDKDKNTYFLSMCNVIYYFISIIFIHYIHYIQRFCLRGYGHQTSKWQDKSGAEVHMARKPVNTVPHKSVSKRCLGHWFSYCDPPALRLFQGFSQVITIFIKIVHYYLPFFTFILSCEYRSCGLGTVLCLASNNVHHRN